MIFIIAHLDWIEFPLTGFAIAAGIWAFSKIMDAL